MYPDKVIYPVKTQHIYTYIFITTELATCFSLLNHLQANS